MSPPQRTLDLDGLAPAAGSVEVRFVEGASFGAASARGPRTPHRHDYHELVWTRQGTSTHSIDGQTVTTGPGTLTIIGRGSVHRIDTADGVHGAVVRFEAELVHAASATGRGDASWLIGLTATHTVDVPSGDVDRLEGLLRNLADEALRPSDARTLDLQRHLLCTLLLWVERWWDDGRPDRPDLQHGGLDLYRRFVETLDRDFARHHDAVHYADALAVPQAALSKTLVEATGMTTKEHITDRRLLEAARLLRFTDLTIGEIAHGAGYADQLYFSRAFRRRYGQAPTAYRQTSMG